jgi:methyltransferase (TIGR00027 family)
VVAISGVTDTALWVAWHRGQETSRENPLYKDPLALVLAGDRGEKIAKKMSSSDFMTWMMALRTKAIDLFLLEAIKSGAVTVINLGAGLDTRPYRMELSDAVTWIEADFPEIISYKNQMLKEYRPVVKLERYGFDLTDRKKLQNFLARVIPSGGVAVVLTEGVIPYLDNAEVEALAEDLKRASGVRFWIQDFRHGGYSQGIPKLWFRMKMKRAPMKFEVGNWFDFFGRFGWTVEREVRTFNLAQTFNRPMPAAGIWSLMMFLVPRKKFSEWMASAGFVMFKNAGQNEQ